MQFVKSIKDKRAEAKKDKELLKKARKKMIAECGGNFKYLSGICMRIIFYTLSTSLLLMFGYIVIGFITSCMPMVMGYLIGSFGFDLSDIVQVMLFGFSGLFFTAWMFLISYLILRKACRVYIKFIKNIHDSRPKTNP